MGNECTSCAPCSGEPEFNDKIDKNASVSSSLNGLSRRSHENAKFVGVLTHFKKSHLKFQANKDKIIKLQSLYRRHQAKKKVA